MKTLLITGGAGYIGSHTTVLLEQLGFRTVIFDNFSNADESALEGIEQILGYRPLYLRGDLRDRASVDATFAAYDFDGVIHFAGLKAVGESCEKPFLYYENNILGSLNLFESMRKYNVRDIVFSSSATVYAAGEKIPLNESSRLGTSNPYGSTKLIIEHILEDLASTQ
jgi:UDP-glucose 4-epimerase